MNVNWVLIIVVSAFIHLISHIGMKKAKNRLAFIWLMYLVVVILYSPIWFLLRQPIGLFLWFVILMSASVKTLYFISLRNAYDHEDFSVVYPIMGGSAPIFLLIGSILIIKENLTLYGIVGIIVIALGLWSINLKDFSQWKTVLQRLRFPGLRWALVAGTCVASYTLIDKIGVQSLNPFLYIYINNSFIFLFTTPFVIIFSGWKNIRDEVCISKGMIFLSGITTLLAISLVLFVVSKGMPAAYAGTLRQISIVLSGVVGLLFLKEKYTFPKAVGSILITFGAVVVSILG